jgi:hypothetical protein
MAKAEAQPWHHQTHAAPTFPMLRTHSHLPRRLTSTTLNVHNAPLRHHLAEVFSTLRDCLPRNVTRCPKQVAIARWLLESLRLAGQQTCGVTAQTCNVPKLFYFVCTDIPCSYISYRQSYAHHPAKKPRYNGPSNGFADHGSEERRGLMSAGAFEDDGDAIIEMDLLPPRWVDVQDEVGDVLKDVTLKSAKLDKLHQKHVLPGFDDDDVKKREEQDIEQLTQEITRGFRECQNAIQRIEKMVKEAKAQGALSKGDEEMAKNIQIALATRVQEVSATFRKKQSSYLNSKKLFAPLRIEGTVADCRRRTPCSRRLRVAVRAILDASAEPIF